MQTLLIVDDHAAFRAIARAALSERFDVVAEAGDASAALLSAFTLRPDVVLLDVQLEHADGFTIAEELVAQDHPPVVVLTSTRDRRDLEPLLARSPARGFIAKECLSADALADLLA